MKKHILIATGVLMLLLTGCNNKPTIITGEDNLKSKTITVNGIGESKIKADVAHINVGVSVENKDAKEAQNINSKVMSDIQKELKEFGIEKENLETLNYSIDMVRDFTQKTRTKDGVSPYPVVGYRVDNTLKITVKETDKIGNVVDAIVKDQYVTINNLSFGLQDESLAKEQAIEDAAANAKKRAEVVAKSLGTKIIGIKSVTVNEMSNNRNYNDSVSIPFASEEAASKSIVSGDVKTKAQVEVLFEIE